MPPPVLNTARSFPLLAELTTEHPLREGIERCAGQIRRRWASRFVRAAVIAPMAVGATSLPKFPPFLSRARSTNPAERQYAEENRAGTGEISLRAGRQADAIPESAPIRDPIEREEIADACCPLSGSVELPPVAYPRRPPDESLLDFFHRVRDVRGSWPGAAMSE